MHLAKHFYMKAFKYFLGSIYETNVCFQLGAIHKRRQYNIVKHLPLPPCPQNVRTGSTSPPLVHADTPYKFRKIRTFLH